MKKSIFTLSVLTTLLTAATAVQAAAPTAELKVKGELTAPTCTVAAPDNGTYDFGRISSTLIKAAATTAVTGKAKTWSVSCDAETYLTFSVVDNRAASVATTGNTYFGLGNVNGTGKIGYYTAVMSDPKVDGVTSYLFTAASGASTFSVYNSVNITKGTNMGWASTTSTLKSGRVFTSDITVNPTLASSATMGGPITDTVNLDGLMTMSFAYGL